MLLQHQFSELQNISSLEEEQRTILKVFLDGKNVFVPLPTNLSGSLSYEVTLLVIGFADLIGQSQGATGGDRQMAYPSPAEYFWLVPEGTCPIHGYVRN